MIDDVGRWAVLCERAHDSPVELEDWVKWKEGGAVRLQAPLGS